MRFTKELLERRVRSGLAASERAPQTHAAAALTVAELTALTQIADDREFLTAAYQAVLNRPPDISGMTSYLFQLQNHVPRRHVLRSLATSGEARAGRRALSVEAMQELEIPVRRRLPGPAALPWRERLLARARDIVRRVWLARFESVEFRLSQVIERVEARHDALSRKTDETASAISAKLDSIVALASTESRMETVSPEIDSTVPPIAAAVGELLAGIADATRELGQQADRLRDENETRRNAMGDTAPLTVDHVAELTSSMARVASEIGVLRGELAQVSEAVDRLRSAVAIPSPAQPPVIHSGSGVVAVHLNGFIIGLPDREWRLAAYLAYRGLPEPGAVAVFRSLIAPGMVVADVGASVGLFSLEAARALGGTGRLYCFEPTPHVASLLRSNLQVNGFAEAGFIDLVEAAVTDRAGTAPLTTFPDNCGHNTLFGSFPDARPISVATTTIDAALAAEPRIHVVKIDAEGAEPLVLRGMRETIRRNPSIRIVMEFAPGHLRRAGTDPEAFLAELQADGFVWQPIQEESAELGQARSDWLLAQPSTNLLLTQRQP